VGSLSCSVLASVLGYAHSLSDLQDAAPEEPSLTKALLAQLLLCAFRLLKTREAHPRQHPSVLGELDVAVLDELDSIAPGVPEVMATNELGARLTGRVQRRVAVVDHETKVAVVVGWLGTPLA
jgi:hypothetical protein